MTPSDVATSPLAATARTDGWLVTLLAASSLAIVAIGIIVAPHARDATMWSLCAAVIVCWVGAGRTTFVGEPRLGWIISAGALVAAVATSAGRIDHALDSALHTHAHVVAALCAPVAMAVSLHVLISLPDGVLRTRARQMTCALWYALAGAVAIYLATTSHVLPPWPVAVGWVLAVATTLPSVSARYVGASATERQLIQSLAAGITVAIIVVVSAETLHLIVDWPRQVSATLLGASALVPIGLVVGSSRRSSRADRVLVYLLRVLGLVVVVSAIYLIALRGFGTAPTTFAERKVFWWSIGAAAGSAVVCFALWNKFDRMATSFTYGAREAPDEVVRTFGSRLTRAIPMDELLLQLVESLRKTLTLSSAEIYTGTGEVLELAVSVPDIGRRSLNVSGDERAVIARAGVSGNAWASVWIPSIAAGRNPGPLRVAPISHAGELLGVIVIFRTVGAVAFREEDDRVLTELARQVGLAMHNAQLDTALQSSLDELRRQADELRASRARVVASGDAERRRVERNLHDGAQQHLVALAINLRLAKDIVVEDPEAAAEMLDELGVAVQDTIKELRELAHGIYPPLLVDSGLTEALRAVANRSPLAVELVTEGIGRYGRDNEAAIYFCCLEALQNAGKHAPDSRVTIRIWEESGGLLFEVSDDGPGFDVALAKGGHGYVNMADRLGAIGGAVRWESEPGHGTTIRGSVPLN